MTNDWTIREAENGEGGVDKTRCRWNENKFRNFEADVCKKDNIVINFDYQFACGQAIFYLPDQSIPWGGQFVMWMQESRICNLVISQEMPFYAHFCVIFVFFSCFLIF